MPRSRLVPLCALTIVAFASTARPASAQDVRWRHDYAAARREATETGRPLLLDFGTEACFWCKKLDATTFRDPKVAKLLNERFIPVKIDADKNPRMAQALGIESYPTLVLATPDGKVVARHPGYADVSEMMTFLNKAPAPKPSAEVPVAQVLPAPAKPVVAVDPEAETWRRAKQQIDADLAALHARIAASLER